MFPPVHYQLFPPVCPDCSLCYECVTCGSPPAVGPTLPTQKQSVLFTWFPVPMLLTQFPVPIVLSMFRVCPLYDPHCSLCTFPVCMYPVCSLCSQCVPSASTTQNFPSYVRVIFCMCAYPFSLRELVDAILNEKSRKAKACTTDVHCLFYYCKHTDECGENVRMHDIVFSGSTESVMKIILSLVETLYSQLEGLYTMFHTLKRSFTHLHRTSSQVFYCSQSVSSVLFTNLLWKL